MREWTVHIEGVTDHADEELADRIIAALAQHAPAVSFGHGQLGVTLSIKARTPGDAINIAAELFLAVVDAPATRLEVDTAA